MYSQQNRTFTNKLKYKSFFTRIMVDHIEKLVQEALEDPTPIKVIHELDPQPIHLHGQSLIKDTQFDTYLAGNRFYTFYTDSSDISFLLYSGQLPMLPKPNEQLVDLEVLNKTNEIIAEKIIKTKKKKIDSHGFVDNLTYLRNDGRISLATGLITGIGSKLLFPSLGFFDLAFITAGSSLATYAAIAKGRKIIKNDIPAYKNNKSLELPGKAYESLYGKNANNFLINSIMN